MIRIFSSKLRRFISSWSELLSDEPPRPRVTFEEAADFIGDPDPADDAAYRAGWRDAQEKLRVVGRRVGGTG